MYRLLEKKKNEICDIGVGQNRGHSREYSTKKKKKGSSKEQKLAGIKLRLQKALFWENFNCLAVHKSWVFQLSVPFLRSLHIFFSYRNSSFNFIPKQKNGIAIIIEFEIKMWYSVRHQGSTGAKLKFIYFTVRAEKKN